MVLEQARSFSVRSGFHSRVKTARTISLRHLISRLCLFSLIAVVPSFRSYRGVRIDGTFWDGDGGGGSVP
jgi:hypothetical protein